MRDFFSWCVGKVLPMFGSADRNVAEALLELRPTGWREVVNDRVLHTSGVSAAGWLVVHGILANDMEYAKECMVDFLILCDSEYRRGQYPSDNAVKNAARLRAIAEVARRQ